MGWSQAEIQIAIAVEIDQSSSAPAVNSDDYAVRRTLINRSLIDWAEATDWDILFAEINSRTSVGSSLATITMPTDFRKLASYPKITVDGTNTYEYPEIDPATKGQYLDSDRYVFFLKSGATVNMILNPPSIISGASLYIPYYRSPGSLASPVDITIIPDDTFLVQKSLYYLYKATEDARFVDAGQQADLILQRLLEQETARGRAWQEDRTKTWLETKFNFRIGRSS